MAARGNALETRFTANIQQFERELLRMQNLNARAAARLAADQARAAGRSSSAWGSSTSAMATSIAGLGAQLKQLAPLIAGAFSVSAVAQAADVYTRYTNQLKVAGLAGTQLKEVQSELYRIAQDNGVELESLGTLYGRAAQSAKELGASQQQLLQFTEGVSLALRVQGGDAASASGALLQLSQALAGGTVRAEEFNSINEGALPILQAVAAGSDKFGGSVANLRKAVLDGKVSSKEFFAAFLEGSSILKDKAANAAFTLDQAFVVLSNSFTKYVGEANAATGATSIMVGVIKSLADNLPLVANALAIIAGIYVASFIPALVRATGAIYANIAANVALQAQYSITTRSVLLGATAMNTARAGAGALAGMLGGPLGIGLTAVAAGLAYWAVKSAEANAAAAELTASIERQAVEFGNTTEQQAKAAAEQNNLSAAQKAALVTTANLTGEAHKLADAWARVAAEAKRAAIEQAQAKLDEAKTNAIGANDAYRAVREEAYDRAAVRPFAERGLGSNLPATNPKEALAYADRQTANTKEKKQADTAQANVRSAQQNLDEIKKRQLDTFKETPVTTPGKPTKASGGSRGRGKTPGDGTEELRRLAIEEQNLKFEQTIALADRLDIQKEILRLETEGKLAAINKQVAEGSLTKAAGDLLFEKETELTRQRSLNLETENQKASAALAIQIQDEENQLRAERLRQESDQLLGLSEYARSVESKSDYEWRALEKRQEADRLEFDLSQRQYEADLRILGITEDKIKAMLAERSALFNNGQDAQSGEQSNRDAKADPSVKNQIISMAEGFGTLNAQLGDIATGSLNNLTKGLTDAVMGAGSLKEAFADMAKSIIANLIQMAIRFVVFEAIGMAFGVPGLGRAAIGLGNTPKGTASIPGLATGTDYARGGLTWVGEKGPELMMLPGGTQVAPNNLLRSALQNASGSGGGANIVNLTTVVNAQDAVLTQQVKGWIAEGQVQAIHGAQKLMSKQQAQRNRNTLMR